MSTTQDFIPRLKGNVAGTELYFGPITYNSLVLSGDAERFFDGINPDEKARIIHEDTEVFIAIAEGGAVPVAMVVNVDGGTVRLDKTMLNDDSAPVDVVEIIISHIIDTVKVCYPNAKKFVLAKREGYDEDDLVLDL